MTQEVLLKIDVPANPAVSVRSQTGAETREDVDNTRYQAFASELGKHIDKQIGSRHSEAQPEKLATSATTAQTADEAKAEKILDKNGNPLPSEATLTVKLTQQLLGDFEGDPSEKQELTQIIEQFVHRWVNNERSDIDLEDGISTLLNQLLDAGLVNQPVATVSQTPEVTLPTTQDVNKVIASVVTTALATSEDPTIQQQAVFEGIAAPQPLRLQQVQTVDQVKTVDPAQKIENTTNKVAQVEAAASVIQRLKEIVIDEVFITSKEAGDKTQSIANAVKQLLTAKSVKTNLNEQTITSVQTPQKDIPLRADILQALTTKTTNASLAQTPSREGALIVTTSPILQGETKLVTDKAAERIGQLVDLLQPAKADEQPSRTVLTDKAGPTMPSLTPVSVTNNNIRADLPTLDIQPSLQTKAWNNVLSSRVVWMASEGIQQAALKLNPANLGPVEVRLTMHNEQANVTFIAHNAVTRDALEQALPRLRESFIENGLELADANVSDQASQQTNDEEMSPDHETDQNGNIIVVKDENIHENAEAVVTDTSQNIKLGLSVYA